MGKLLKFSTSAVTKKSGKSAGKSSKSGVPANRDSKVGETRAPKSKRINYAMLRKMGK